MADRLSGSQTKRKRKAPHEPPPIRRKARPLGSRQQQIAEQHLPLVSHVLGKMKFSATAVADREDMFQAGVMGLMRAVKMFRPSKGVKFSTYAAIRIRGAILDSLREYDRLSRGQRKDVHAGLMDDPIVRPIHGGKNPDDRELDLRNPEHRDPGQAIERADLRAHLVEAVKTILTPIEWCVIRARLRGQQPDKDCKTAKSSAWHHERHAIAKLRRYLDRQLHPPKNCGQPLEKP